MYNKLKHVAFYIACILHVLSRHDYSSSNLVCPM